MNQCSITSMATFKSNPRCSRDKVTLELSQSVNRRGEAQSAAGTPSACQHNSSNLVLLLVLLLVLYRTLVHRCGSVAPHNCYGVGDKNIGNHVGV